MYEYNFDHETRFTIAQNRFFFQIKNILFVEIYTPFRVSTVHMVRTDITFK